MPAIKSLQPMTRARLGYVPSFHSNLSLLLLKLLNNQWITSVTKVTYPTQLLIVNGHNQRYSDDGGGVIERLQSRVSSSKPFNCVTHIIMYIPRLDREEPSSRSNHSFSLREINHTFLHFTQPSYSLLHTDVQ